MKHVLVVDDEKELAEMISEQLANTGYKTGVAFNGVEAVLSVLEQHWDVVLMDIRMPILDGINALKIIRKVAPQVAVINFSGQSGEADVAEALKLGAFACLSKPIRLEEVLKIMVVAPDNHV